MKQAQETPVCSECARQTVEELRVTSTRIVTSTAAWRFNRDPDGSLQQSDVSWLRARHQAYNVQGTWKFVTDLMERIESDYVQEILTNTPFGCPITADPTLNLNTIW